MMLNVVRIHDPLNISLKMGNIVWYDFLWYPKLANDVILYELGHMLGF